MTALPLWTWSPHVYPEVDTPEIYLHSLTQLLPCGSSDWSPQAMVTCLTQAALAGPAFWSILGLHLNIGKPFPVASTEFPNRSGGMDRAFLKVRLCCCVMGLQGPHL
jgi:hypothetical protein